MRSLRCLVGSHHWEGRVVREEGGQKSLVQRCTRCGTQRSRWLPGAGDVRPDVGDHTTPRPLGMDGAGADG